MILYSTSIHFLDDDSLLNIFYLYRLVSLGRDEADEASISNWPWWYKPAQICRRWRSLILGSASHLGLCLVCTNGTPIADMLAHSPPFPLIINFIHTHHDRDITAEDEEGIVFALQQRNRVRHIHFRIPIRNLQRFVMAIDEEYPMLESLVMLHPTRDNSTNLILPQSFRAPHLQRLVLSGVAFPTKSPLLTTAISRLVTLRLYLVHQSAYFPPNVLLQSLSTMPQLETLVIAFLFPVPNRDVERQLLLTSIRTHVTLPNLRDFTFQGPSSYLEALVRWATTPRLEKLGIVFYNELMFSLPHLQQFIRTAECLKFRSALIEFSSVSARAAVYSSEGREKWAFRMDVNCEQFDWQLSCMAQIFSALGNAFSGVEHLILRVGRGNLSPDLEQGNHEIDRMEWRKLLSSFSNVKTIFVDHPLIAGVSCCLRLEDGELPLELLTKLQELIYTRNDKAGIDDEDLFKSFIDSRQNTGCPVTLVPRAGVYGPSEVSLSAASTNTSTSGEAGSRHT
jgi:hypothetical protein